MKLEVDIMCEGFLSNSIHEMGEISILPNGPSFNGLRNENSYWFLLMVLVDEKQHDIIIWEMSRYVVCSLHYNCLKLMGKEEVRGEK